MPTYTYKARDINGKLIRGVIEAENPTFAAKSVEGLGFIPISVSSRRLIFDKNILSLYFRTISHQELLVFTRQLSTLITTGAPLIQSLNNVLEQTQNPRFKQVLSNIITSLKNGINLSDSLAQYPKIFPKLYVSLVRVGETGGLLDKVLLRLADLSTQEISLRSRLRSAITYPIVLAVVAFLIINFVLLEVLPKFVSIFEASQAKIPLPTKILLSSSNLLTNFWWLLLILIILGLLWLRKYYRSTRGRLRIDQLILQLPLFGPLILKIMVSRFSRSVAALTKSGIPVLEALAVVENTLSNAVLQGIVKDIRSAISEGENLVQTFRQSGLFPPMVIQLIDTGEHSGKLDEMFDQIANFYEPEIESTIRDLTSLLEPAMLLIMGGIVTFIALSVLLPIFNLISIIRR